MVGTIQLPNPKLFVDNKGFIVVDTNVLMDIATSPYRQFGISGLALFVKLVNPHFLFIPYDVQNELDQLKQLPNSQRRGFTARQAWKQLVEISKDRLNVILELVSQRPSYPHEKKVDDIVVRRAMLISDFYSKVCVISADNRVQSQSETAGVVAFSYLNCERSVRTLAGRVEQYLTSVTQ